MKKTEKIFLDIARNVETVITAGPVPQQDAKEPRFKIVISGPKRLLTALLDLLTDEKLDRKPVKCKKKPVNCICNPDHWEGWWKVCERFEKIGSDDRCKVCDHKRGCHKK